jgi:hypothetical protein
MNVFSGISGDNPHIVRVSVDKTDIAVEYLEDRTIHPKKGQLPMSGN